MSFSKEVKEELHSHIASTKEGVAAELAGLLSFGCNIQKSAETAEYIVTAENSGIAEKVFTLARKNITLTNGIRGDIPLSMRFPADFLREAMSLQGIALLEDRTSMRAFLRGVYICNGSMSDPEKSYHLEFDCATEDKAQLVADIISAFEIEAKQVIRKKYYVVYLKDGSAICDLLNIMGAHISLMNFENYRILKDMRNSVNRQVNCETANIAKTVSAAAKQVQEIELIRDTIGLGALSPSLQAMASLRLEYPEASLLELGALSDPPIGKSGVNHRLRKISEVAEKLGYQ